MNGLRIFANQTTFSSSTPTDLTVREQQLFDNIQVSIETESTAIRDINEPQQTFHSSFGLLKTDVLPVQLRDAKFYRISAHASIGNISHPF
jgi:hypothetical protein